MQLMVDVCRRGGGYVNRFEGQRYSKWLAEDAVGKVHTTVSLCLINRLVQDSASASTIRA